VNKFIKKNTIKNFTIVADAAMISDENVIGLRKNNINYIVGARLGNLSMKLLCRLIRILFVKMAKV
jgi:transposase